ncbi:acyltransferase [Algoriphagus winogradskyi]|uniref:Transferase hexapeptide (Six repeat-containing protein) n=1 Tax=Algoriphagus winogradskyi TaxID=237017 RepID=A0ABY1PIQ2_9BACT|nr:acyltransferase [Algoriphagus winogradskyi]SMP33405.1 transferase hexapeptide (six repeat-containing protein) [Algoriphagus winogradskyi]
MNINFDKIRQYFLRLLPNKVQAKLLGVEMGENNFISSRFWSSEPYLIKIGNNCQITNGVKFFTHGGAGAVRLKHPKFDCFGKIEIGDFVYFGTNSLIMPGVTIGNNVLIAAGSVVVSSIPENVVIGGNPARIICSIEQYLERNLTFNLNTKGLSDTEKRKVILSNIDKLIKKEMLIA